MERKNPRNPVNKNRVNVLIYFIHKRQGGVKELICNKDLHNKPSYSRSLIGSRL